jgi:hypothetical protein
MAKLRIGGLRVSGTYPALDRAIYAKLPEGGSRSFHSARSFARCKAWEKAQRDGNPIPLPPAGTAIKPHE